MLLRLLWLVSWSLPLLRLLLLRLGLWRRRRGAVHRRATLLRLLLRIRLLLLLSRRLTRSLCLRLSPMHSLPITRHIPLWRRRRGRSPRRQKVKWRRGGIRLPRCLSLLVLRRVSVRLLRVLLLLLRRWRLLLLRRLLMRQWLVRPALLWIKSSRCWPGCVLPLLRRRRRPLRCHGRFEQGLVVAAGLDELFV